MIRRVGIQKIAVLAIALLAVIGVHAQQVGQQVVQRPEDISPLLYGEKIPQATLPDASGKEVDLVGAVAANPTVLVFYRGGWCPYCSLQLAGLQEALPELEKLGYQLLAISTDSPKKLRESATKEKLRYTLLSDADLELAKRFGIAYKAPKAYWGMLPKTTGGKNTELLLPVPSVFIVDQAGIIQFEYINPDFKQRLSAALLLAAAKSVRDER
ncbi:peroxiredoxin family protein [Parapedobacter sp. GCM10030251]|uniref:peroxiredoxin family protein n=1 Tax=Parapedobacter sp. GCM10030251 TaxID=3273419 RepID=UPI0036107FDB